MTSAVKQVDRNVEGILAHMRDYMDAREQQLVRINKKVQNVIKDVTWMHLDILRHVLQKPKAFGGEKFRVADVLSGADDLKRKALLSSSDQNSIMDEIIDRPDEATGKKAADSIHDMRTLFRAIDPSLESLVQLIQFWVKWDLPDAADLHSFDEQIRRLKALRSIQLTDDIRGRYRQALGKPADVAITDDEIFQMEMKRLEQIASRFCARRHEDEPFQLIIRREGEAEAGEEGPTGEPYDYKLRQCEDVTRRLEEERRATAEKFGGDNNSSSDAIELQA